MTLFLILLATSWIWIPALLIWLFFRNKKSSASSVDLVELETINDRRDAMWHEYIASFLEVAKTAKEKRLLNMLLDGDTIADYNAAPAKTAAVVAETAAVPVIQAAPAEFMSPFDVSVGSKPDREPLDTTLLLLYFGAFLLVASVGLFVAISGLSGVLRTSIVAITAAVLYGGGLWLYQTNKKLAQAGVSFVGTGMIVAPLTGVAWYNLVAEQSGAGVVWLATSAACLLMYTHALRAIKNDFMAYLLIGSFVSSIESAALVTHAPSYAYAWGLIAAGILLAVSRKYRGQPDVFVVASAASSQLLIPLSVLGSVVLVPDFGSVQLSVTLLLSGLYYSLLAVWEYDQRQQLLIAAQASYIAAVGGFVYAFQDSLVSVGITATGIAALYTVAIAVANKRTVEQYTGVGVAVTVSSIGLILSIESAWATVAALSIGIVLATVIWQKLDSIEALQIGALGLIILPFVIAQYALRGELGDWQQIALSLASMAIIAMLTEVSVWLHRFKPYYKSLSGLLLIAVAAALIPAALSEQATVLAAVVGAVMLCFVVLHLVSKDSVWLLSSAVVVFVPLAYAFVQYSVDDTMFSVALTAALVWNIGVSLITREAIVRWLVVGSILMAPFALGGGGLGFHWGPAGYALGYLLAMASCLAARTIARGKLLVSFKVPIASYYAEASEAYVAGYAVAGATAIVFSLYDDKSQIVTTLVLAAIACAVVIASKIEHKAELVAILPVVLQAMVISGVRPDLDNHMMVGVTAMLAVMTAIATYAVGTSLQASDLDTAKAVRLVSVATAYLGPSYALTGSDPSLLLPVSLLLAGLLTYDYNREHEQSAKEASLAVSIVAVHWFVYLLGYHNVHVHTHILAIFLLGFAAWRAQLEDDSGSTSYLQALFFVVTIPLVVQGIGGESGGIYGLLLIAEQAAFMLAGATFGQRFLLRWGLWTALAAILFQLRGLGWAFLSLLAVIVIGVAIYRLQKHPPDEK